MAKSFHPSIVRRENVLLWVCPPKNREKLKSFCENGTPTQGSTHPRVNYSLGSLVSVTPHHNAVRNWTEPAPRTIQYRHRNCCWNGDQHCHSSLFLTGNISHRACLNSFCRSWSTNELEKICHNIKKAFWILCVWECVWKNNQVVERNSKTTRDTLRISRVMNEDRVSIQFDTSKNPKQQKSIWGWWQ